MVPHGVQRLETEWKWAMGKGGGQPKHKQTNKLLKIVVSTPTQGPGSHLVETGVYVK